jgi:hypothetical protein
MMKHKVEMHIVIEWDDDNYPYMSQSILNDWHSPGKLQPDTSEILWGLHGGDFRETCTKFDSIYTTEGT